MNDKSPRRPFRFSLRSLLLVMTLVCIWLAWESSVVRERRNLLADLQSRPGVNVARVRDYPNGQPPGLAPNRVARIPRVRQWLGDEAIQGIWYTRTIHNLTAAEIARLAKVFPEAELTESELHLEPCHPGCFPRGTPVETPQGRRAIESINAGDEVVAFRKSGERFTANVQSIFITDNRLWRVTTEAGELFTTETQPLCRATDETRPTGQLKAGDTILRWESGELTSVKVLSVAPTERRERVFNLVLGDCEAFIANGYLARSKPPIPSTDVTAE